MRQKSKIAILLVLFLTVTQLTDAKRTFGGRSRSSSSSSSSIGRRTSHTSSSGSVTKPASQNSHADLAKLSYPGYNSQPNRPSSSGSSGSSVIHKPSAPEVPKTVGAQNNAPPSYGWNVPNKPEAPAVAVNKPPSYSQANMGPPPAYSPHNNPGGAKTNINEPPPPYKPNPAAPPPYPVNNQPAASYPRQPSNVATQPLSHGNTAAAHNTAYRHYGNSSGGGIHTPIQPHNANPVMGSYPHQTGGALPQGAVMYPQGHIPQGAVLYPQGSFPQGGYPGGGGFPAGGGFAGGYPQGAPVYAGAGIQPGIYPAGSFPQKSSGPGLGTGLIAGALGGAILGHALTPTHNVHHQQDTTGQDRVIIINNTPGQASVAPQSGGIVQPAAAPQPAPGPQPGVAPQPGAIPPPVGQPAPGQPMQPPVGSGDSTVPLAPFPPAVPGQPQQPGTQPANPAEGYVPLAPLPQNDIATNSTEQPQNANTTNAGYVACFPVNVTDPADPSNMTTVQQIVCYNYAEPPPPPQPVQQQEMQAGAQPAVPPGTQPEQPTLMRMPGDYAPPQDMNAIPTQRTSTANLAANSNIKSAATSNGYGTLSVVIATIAFLAVSMH